jgi:hypothetical protein
VIVDEAQRIKNWNTVAARALKRIACPYAIVLTGTPLENRLEELISIVQFVDQHRLGPTWRLLHEHQQRDDGGRVVGYKDLGRIGATLAPIMLRRRKAEVLAQLPERIDNTLFVPMTPQQWAHHNENGDIVARIGSLLTQGEARQAGPASTDPWAPLLDAGLSLIAELARRDGDAGSASTPWIERDAATGRDCLKLPLPEPATLDRIAQALGRAGDHAAPLNARVSAMTLEQATLEAMRRQHPAWRLLAAESAPLPERHLRHADLLSGSSHSSRPPG